MSTPAVIRWDQAYNRNGDPKLPRAVVNAIRTHVDNHTLTGWVKAKTLAEYTGLKERAVRAQISANVKAGWLEIVQSGNSSGLANTYRLSYPKGVVQNTFDGSVKGVVHDTIGQEKGVADDTVRVSSSAGKGVVHDTPTTPITSPGSSPKRRTTKGNGVVDDTLAPDPFFGSRGGSFSEHDRRSTSESKGVVHDTVSEGALDDTLSAEEIEAILTERLGKFGKVFEPPGSRTVRWPSGKPLPGPGEPGFDPFAEYLDETTGEALLNN
ncbi:hypothetical protein [Mycobacterium timonense]|uniref:Helix-turn-helix domain-containing protein n=1 Tax=Mycobacterium timonense TaxID=701043 RepID=A0ABX3TP11_9MYCO|nr:hypothetical protein [Mycobacterium timonense]ORB80465.1 hypothetical protein BST46_08635 [Mycobacterium timonense]